MDLLDGFVVDRLLAAPLHIPDGSRPDPVPVQLFAALTAAHAELSNSDTTRPAMFASWYRGSDRAAMRVLVGGRPNFPPAEIAPRRGCGQRPVAYPPGSVGIPADPADVAALVRLPAWVRCTGGFDPLWRPQEQRADPPRRGGFDDYVVHLRESFAWLVIAEPIPSEILAGELASLEVRIPRLRQRENSPSDRVTLEHAEGRYRELSRARSVGMWSVHLLVGGQTPRSAWRAAALLCAASDLDRLPYALVPDPAVSDSLDQAWTTVREGDERLRSPFQAPAELLAALARPPRRELPGIRLLDRATFDVTAEHEVAARFDAVAGRERPAGITIGDILDEADMPVGRFTVSTRTLTRHAFVTGATGAGKSQTVRHLLEQLHHVGVPWLVIEPAKAEYAAMAGRIGSDRVLVIRPGALDAPPVGLNPLEPEPGFPLATHLDLVRALFLAAFAANEPFPQVLTHALERCYREYGWDPVLGTPRTPAIDPGYPRLGDLQRSASQVVADVGYGRETRENVQGFIDVRLGSLRLGTVGRFLGGGHTLDAGELLGRDAVIELEDVGDDQAKAFLIGLVLIRVYEHLRVHRDARDSGLRHVTAVEEAHRLLRRTEPGSPSAHAVELFVTLLAEIRAYGEGLVVAEQIPAKITPDVVKNTALKIVHRLPAADDRAFVGATMNLDDAQSRHVVSLPPGRAAVFADGMDRPVRIDVPLGEAREAAATSNTASLIRIRTAFAGCPADCRARPCTLRRMESARHLTEREPRLVLWMEVLAGAHVVAEAEPEPDRGWLSRLCASADPDVLVCATAQLADGAVACRHDALVPYYRPQDLAAHLAARLRHWLLGGTDCDDGPVARCDGTETGWQAGQFRWVDVARDLMSDGIDPGRPHPGTERWRARGLELAGRTPAEQLDALRAHPDSWVPDQAAVTGGVTPRRWEQAAARLSWEMDPARRLTAAAHFLRLDRPWLVPRFLPQNAHAQRPTGGRDERTAGAEPGAEPGAAHAAGHGGTTS